MKRSTVSTMSVLNACRLLLLLLPLLVLGCLSVVTDAATTDHGVRNQRKTVKGSRQYHTVGLAKKGNVRSSARKGNDAETRDLLSIKTLTVSSFRGKGKKKGIMDKANEVCTFNEELNESIFDLFSTPRSEVSSFLDQSGRAIDEVRPFIDLVRSTFDGTPEEGLDELISDEDFLLLAMAPNPILGDGGVDNGPLVPFDSPIFDVDPAARALQAIDCDNYDTIIAARILDFIIEGFDFTFALVGAGGPFGSLGGAIGRSIGRKILSGPNGRAFARRLLSTISSRNIRNIGGLLSSTIAEVGLNGVLDAVSEASSNPWSLALFGVGLAANIAATFATGGLAFAAKVVSAGLAANDLFSAVDALIEARDACQPSASPSPQPTPSPTPPPTRPTDTGGRGRTSGVFGDPHLSTFDRLRFACQAGGEFTMLTSLDTPEFVIQERFVSVGSNQCSQASVSAGVVVNEPGLPRVQISLPRPGPTGAGTGGPSSGSIPVFSNECPVDLYVDGVLQDSLSYSGGMGAVEVSSSGSTGLQIRFPFTGLQIRPTVRFSTAFGCHLNLQVFLPFTYRMDETLLGLLGTPNGNRSDDWVTPAGIQYSNVPETTEDSVFDSAYTYCTTQWCIRDSAASAFTYRSDESFDEFNECDETFAVEIEASIQDAIARNDPIVGVCGTTNLFCLLDGLCGGGVEDAQAVLMDEAEVRAAQEVSNPTDSPSMVPSIVPSAAPTRTMSPSPRGKGGKGGKNN